jgi:hypothetical protein
MNELDLIRTFRGGAAAPTAAATARAERAWRPAGRRRPPRRARRAALAGTLAAFATAVALTVSSGGDHGVGGGLGAQPASAAETLRLAASRVGAGARAAPSIVTGGGLTRPLRPGEYWYVKRHTAWAMSGDGYSVVQPAVREDWVGVDGERRWRTRIEGPLEFPTARDREGWEAARRPPAEGDSEYRVRAPRRPPFYDGAKLVTYEQLLALPRNPRALYERVRAAAVACACGPSVRGETFTIVGDLLRDPPLPADLRAALLRAAALIPGIELVDRVRDVAGREGVGVALDSNGERETLIFDRDTHELLGEQSRRGHVVSGSADLESAIVSSLDAVP